MPHYYTVFQILQRAAKYVEQMKVIIASAIRKTWQTPPKSKAIETTRNDTHEAIGIHAIGGASFEAYSELNQFKSDHVNFALGWEPDKSMGGNDIPLICRKYHIHTSRLYL